MNKQQYDQLAEIVFRLDADGKPTYPGYRPEVRELPNGDGKVDADKRYAHVAGKYLHKYAETEGYCDEYDVLERALVDAYHAARNVAFALNVPGLFFPNYGAGALRILEYPVGATSNLHTDFDLFSLVIYRDQIEKLKLGDSEYGRTEEQWERLHAARDISPWLHIGELGELIGLGPATPHEVVASDKTQHAIVYFAIPAHDAVLPTGQTVGEWLNERMSRSRTSKS